MTDTPPILETFEAITKLLKAQRDRAIEERDAARDMCCRLEYALYMLGAWDPTNPVGREMIAEDLLRGGAASIERAQ